MLPSIPPNTDTVYNFMIGGIRLVPAPDNTESHGTKYKLYELVADECLENIELSGGTGGSTSSWQYNGPFQVVAGATVGQVKVTGVDSILSSDITYAGYICYNGTGCELEPEKTVNIGASGSTHNVDIWANIYADDVSFDTSPDPTSSTPPPYSVRLARVSGYHTV